MRFPIRRFKLGARRRRRAVGHRASIPRFALHLVAVAAIAMLAGCETPQQKKRVKLPGEDEVSTLGWNRGFPGDPQPGLGALPQSR